MDLSELVKTEREALVAVARSEGLGPEEALDCVQDALCTYPDRGAEAVERRGALLTGDVVQLIPDRTHVSFMRSYPNIIPLSAPAVVRIGATLEPFAFDVIYGAFFDRVIPRGGKDAVRRSVARYIAIVTGDGAAEQR